MADIGAVGEKLADQFGTPQKGLDRVGKMRRYTNVDNRELARDASAGELIMTPCCMGQGDCLIGWDGVWINRTGVTVQSAGAIHGDDGKRWLGGFGCAHMV